MKNESDQSFITALEIIQKNPKKIQRYMLDHQLSVAQKRILDCWGLIEQSRFDQVLSILDSMNGYYDPLVEAQKYLILGITLNHKNQSALAIPLLQKSFDEMKSQNISSYGFIAIHQLFLSYDQLGDRQQMKHALDEMAKYSESTSTYLLCLEMFIQSSKRAA